MSILWKDSDIKVSVIITAHNYGKYLCQCIESVIYQRFEKYEVIVVNDGSTDDTGDIIEGYSRRYPAKIRTITLEGVGLAKACNIGIDASVGGYIIRLDADDYFDENILLVESNILDMDPNIHMVYPDYYRINKHGEILDSFRLQKVNDEVKLLDRSPLAAGAMFRKSCYDLIGGYNENLRYQEDYDFWIRFIDKFKVYNVNLPLMYYRRHDMNMSNNHEERMEARRYVKRSFVQEKGLRDHDKTMAVIPAMGLFRNTNKLAIKHLNGKPLIAYTIEEAAKSDLIERVIVSTEDQEIAEISSQYGAEVPFLRPLSLARTNVPFDDVLRHLIREMKDREGYEKDLIVVLPYFTPFRKVSHIDEAIDTMLLHGTDSVISVAADIDFHWKPDKYGLAPVGYQKRLLREDRETMYRESGSIYVVRTENLKSGGYLGKVVGHTEMSQIESWRIENDFDFWVAEKIIAKEGS